ncbi:MFS transporter [Streptomyces sp. NBC_00842]|uniref:MFS transporter n=1 Tax=Streptomyces sp. NBC_00842 TaxID=2975848 RepID=UPI0038670387|nr:MFS transporter [Streptomyces sp. NBC_00842]WTA48378.1 MFS transporter [Streptomyces sp. NBC_00842]
MTTDASAKWGPQEFIDQKPMSRRQRLIVAVCLLMMVAEGLDTTIAAFVYPRIVKDWGTDLDTVTATVTLGVAAMIVGGVAAGPLADRYGRKGVTVIGTTAFGLGTAGMGLAHGIGVLAGLRIVACLGLGAVLPTVMALVADWTPAKRRVQMVALAFAGVTAGTTIGGILASALIPAYGWPTLLGVCGIAPLLLIPAVVLFIPESVSVLAARRRPPAELRRALATVAADQDLSRVDWDQSTVRRRPRPAPRVILSRGFAPTTLLLWLCFFLAQGVVFVILSYLPLLVERMGLTAAQAAVSVAVFGWGGLTGQLSVSFVLKRFDRFRVLAGLWVMSALGLGAAALWAAQFTPLLATAFLLGLCLPAVTSALQAIAAVAYPSSARATGVSWANSVGKLGPLVGGLLGGMMVDAGWTLATVLFVLAVPVGVGLLTTLTLHARSRGQRAEPHSEPRPLPGLVSEQS